ncbi:glycosyltransferase family 4 protein [Actomonas aquatica]|uniref:Glycosyltransferase family 4 protein n=1 Tax=Actomonas aquatica TaxID=2866162 RepID=A0ABZ1C4T0_9BACT|nr:glycosyltransferase family 4 protein [Opitutus sp. WL0086]WRQ86742.1 glycosyltransferase family 4 protein [Opitutus sp. WL0086]
MPAAPELETLHYLGYDEDVGGIVSIVRALAETGLFGVTLGLNRGAHQRRQPALPVVEFSPLAGETISPGTWWRARQVAREVQVWLQGAPGRVFHGHSRAGLLVALALRARGEARVVASVHAYGRQRWFYRAAARRLGARLFWLSPAMKAYYGVPGSDWTQCIGGGVSERCFAVPRTAAEAPPWIIAGIGDRVRWKGWHRVLDALAALPEAERAALRFEHIGGAGDPAYVAELETRTRSAGLSDVVTWRGPQPDSAGLLAEAHALVVASDHEPFSMAMLEAMAAGVPVLAAAAGGAVDVVSPPRLGVLYSNSDDDGLARELGRLARGEGVARVSPDPAAVRRFAAPAVAEQWQKVYRL